MRGKTLTPSSLWILLFALTASTLLGGIARADTVTIDEPVADATYLTTATIATNGTCEPLFLTMTVKLIKGTNIVSSHTLEGNQGVWSWDFEPPTGGWAVGDDYKVEVWSGGTKRDDVAIKVVSPGT